MADRDGVDWAGLPSWDLVRAAAGLLVATLIAVLGALILGEYQFEGWLPLVAGLLFGLVVAEAAVEIGGRATAAVAAVCGALSGAALVWAGWISAGEGLEPIPGWAWVAAGIGAAAAAGRVLATRRARVRTGRT